MPASYFAVAFAVEVDGATLPADLSHNITEVKVVQQIDKPDSFTLKIANPYPEMPWTHKEQAERFREYSGIKIRMGYIGDKPEQDMPLMMDGEITSISPDFPERGVPTIEIEGLTRMHRLNGGNKTRTFRKMTDKQIVERIAGELSLTAKAEQTNEVHEYVIQYNQPDIEFLVQRAGRIRYELLVQGKELIFRRAQDSATKIYTLVWGHPKDAIDPGKQLMPLKSFKPEMNTLRQVSEVVVKGKLATGDKTIEARADQNDVPGKMGGTLTGSEAVEKVFGKRKEEIVVDTPIQSEAEAKELAVAIYKDRALEFVTGDGTTIGLPDLRAGRVVELAGLGKRFSGEYYITKATHTIGDAGYETSFSVRRNAIG